MAPRSSPTVRRWQLGGDLRRLREAAGLTIEQVAGVLECSSSKISRLETGQVHARPGDLRELLTLYHASDDQREALLQLAREARQKSWWHEHSEQAFRRVVDYEVAAVSIRTFGGLLVPGLLQTAEYARAVFTSLRPEGRAEELDRKVEWRLARQALLVENDPPFYWVILDEAALRRHVGGRDVILKQLRHLTEIAALPNVTLQVIPFVNGGHAGLSGDFTIFSFAGSVPDIVYLENLAEDLFLENVGPVGRHTWAFDHLRAAALGPDESVQALLSMAEND